MPKSVTTFLMFDGVAEPAMNLYLSVFKGELRKLERWGDEVPAMKGLVKSGQFTLGRHELIAFDSPAKHAFTFTPATSLFVECESEAELEQAYAQLFEGGQALMPLGDYGFSRKFGWINDRFGVSWQLNLT